MPYFITDEAADCAGWAVVKDDGEVIGCHDSKGDAIDQMVAVSVAEGIEPGGERYAATAIEPEQTMIEATPVEPRSKDSGVEFRQTTGELRADAEGRFVGYAAVFNSPSEPLPFTERIAPGAFGRSLRNRKRDVRLYVNHNSDMVLASRRSGTLALSEDDRGLLVEAELPNTSYARDLRELMATGVVDRMSFGFSVVRGGDKWSEDGAERTLTQVSLHEVSVVTGFPAYEQTSAALRSLERLSHRTAMDVEDIAEVLSALADGEDVDDERAQSILDALQSARKPEPVADLLGLKAKQIDLLSKKVI